MDASEIRAYGEQVRTRSCENGQVQYTIAEMLTEIAAQLAEMNGRGAPVARDVITEAARALVQALDACEQHINGAFGFAAIHGTNYTGPTYGKELDRLRELLPDEPRKSKEEQR
jgi:hypothetical protein